LDTDPTIGNAAAGEGTELPVGASPFADHTGRWNTDETLETPWMKLAKAVCL
jgi:hypothetical protein